MKKKSIIILILFCLNYVDAMEEREDKLPQKVKDMIKKYHIFELLHLPDELLIPIFFELAKEMETKGLRPIAAINKLRLVNKRINNIINSLPFVDKMILYWAKKYDTAPLIIAKRWAIPGVDKWLEINKELINKIDPKTGESPLMHASQIDDNRWQLRLINAGIISENNKERQAILFRAIDRGNLDLIKLLISKNFLKINRELQSPLSYARRSYGKFKQDVIKLLINNGVDINEVDYRGRTVLFDAINNQDIEFIEWLISKGANLHILDKDGLSPLNYARELWLYKKSDDKKAIIKVLIDNGADINEIDKKKKTLLIDAIKNRDFEFIMWLLSKGASILDTKGNLFLYYGNLDTVKTLINRGVIDINQTDEKGQSLIFRAIYKADPDFIKWVAESKGVNLNIVDKQGMTPLKYAQSLLQNFPQHSDKINNIIALLKQYGAQ